MRELDEIEMELGGKMLYRCDHAGNCSNKECTYHSSWSQPLAPFACAWLGYAQVRPECIPVEPERVRPEQCTLTEGECVNNGGDWCPDCYWWRKSSHTYAQRVGMLERENADWIVVLMRPNGKGDLCNLENGIPSRYMGTEDEARAFLGSDLVADYPNNTYRAFRWSDGLKGE